MHGEGRPGAKLCLREACVMALGPGGDLRTKIGALGIVLKYTKPKSAQRQRYLARRRPV
jgi:hypothetical protein